MTPDSPQLGDAAESDIEWWAEDMYNELKAARDQLAHALLGVDAAIASLTGNERLWI